MTSTNDGKEVKSYQTSGPKGKTYFIELYKSLEARLSEAPAASERTKHLCEAWRRVHNLCLHSALTAHSHLLSWLQRHTARTVLPVEWQSPERKEDHAKLEEAIDAFIGECRAAAAARHGSLPWEEQLVARGEWFKRILEHPWQHPVLSCLLNTESTSPTDDEVLEWLKEERGVTFVTRLHTLVAEKCDDIAISLVGAVMDRVRGDTVTVSDADQSEEPKDKPENVPPNFGDKLREEAGFTVDVWEMLTDIEFVLLHKRDSSRCIALAKQTPLRSAYQLIERLQSRLETSPREKRLWKYSKEVAVLIAQVVIARCMVVPVCAGGARAALYCCARSLARLARARLPAAAAALAAPAPTAAHLHTLAAAVDAQLAQKNDATMKPFVCELYVRAITAGMNELERLKLKTEKDTEARSMEATLANWFVQLGGVLASSDRVKCECALTAFSLHPSPQMFERIRAAPPLPPINLDTEQPSEATKPEFGSWASDSRGQSNFVKTSETLNLKARQNQANVLSTAILTEGEALGLSPELCQDITVLLSGPRVKTLSWDMDRELLLENCRAYLERTHGGTKAVTTELKYLNLNPDDFQYLPEEDEDETNIYYGIEKGYEHLVEFQEPEDIWEGVCQDVQKETLSQSSEEFDFVQPQRRKKNKKTSNTGEDDPLSFGTETKRKEKKERPHSKERSKERKKTDSEKKPKTDPLEIGDGNQEKKDKPKKVRKKEKAALSSLVGLKVGQKKTKQIDSDADSQKSVQSTSSDMYDATFPMRSPSAEITPTSSQEHKETDLYIKAYNRKYRPQSVSGIRVASPSPSKSYSELSRNNSPTHISEAVKNSLTNLLEYRRQRAIIHSEASPMDKINISPKAVVIPEIPKSYISKQDMIALQNPKVDLHKVPNAAIPSPVIQYASKSPEKPIQSQYGSPYQGRMTPSERCFSTPPSTDRFLDNVNLIPIYDKNEPSHSRSAYTPYPNASKAEDIKRKDLSNVNYEDYLHEYSLNSYKQHMEKNNASKKCNRPDSRATPVERHVKPENRTQSSKQTQIKKPDGTLNTFSRLSYYKNKQTDMKKSQELPQSQPVVSSKLDGFIMNHLLQSDTKPYANQVNNYPDLVRRYEKPQATVKTNHPLLTNILQNNTLSTQEKPAFPMKTGPSDKDQNDLLLLLRQQKALNIHNTHVASKTFSHVPLNSPIASGSKTYTDAICDPKGRSAVPNDMSNPGIGVTSNHELTKAVKEGKVFNVLSTSIIKAADQKTPDSKPKPVQGKPKKTESRGHKNSKSEVRKHPEEWENVMDAILKQKTPYRGPNALEIALNKSSFEKAFMDSLQKPTKFFAVPDKTSSVLSRPDYDHETLKKSNYVATSSSLKTRKKRKTAQHTKDDTKRQSLPEKSSKTKKSSTPTVAELLKQRSDNEKMLENLINQNQIYATKRDPSGVKIILPETTPKQETVNPKPVQQWLHDLTKSAAHQRSAEMSNEQQNNNDRLKDMLKKNNNITMTQVKQTTNEKPKKEKKPVSGVRIQQTQVTQDVGLRQTHPTVSGIPNSDYDLLDELMDDDLRKEIGELSSDEESYITTSQAYLRNAKPDNTIINVAYDQSKDISSKLPVGTNTKCKQNDVQTIAQILTQQPLTNNDAQKMTVKPQIQPSISLITKVLNVTQIVTKPTQIHAFSNANMLHNAVTVEPNVFINTAPPSTSNVLIMPSSIMYEGYSSPSVVQTVPNLTPKAYIAMSNTPNISLYQATQFAAPVVNPVIIANAIAPPIVNVVPLSSTIQQKLDTKVDQTPSNNLSHAVPNKSRLESIQECTADVEKIETTSIKPDEGIEMDVQKVETKVSSDDVSTKTGERKVLKEVQEKHTDEKIESKKRVLKASDKDIKIKADQERIKRKRMAILNRKINYLCGMETIALGYSPLQLTSLKENKIDKISDQNQDDAILSNQINLQEQLNEEVKSPATPDSYKENKSEPVRRILLRSTNKLKPKLNTPSASQKPSLDKKHKRSLVHSVDIAKEPQSGNASNIKSKRVSKRNLNKSAITPNEQLSKTTKTLEDKQKTSNTHANSTPNKDLETEQFSDIEAELLGSTVSKITPVNNSDDAHMGMSNSAQKIETMILVKEKTETLLIETEKPQQSDNLSNSSISHATLQKNKPTKATEFEESLQAKDFSVITDVASNETKVITKSKNNLVKPVDSPPSEMNKDKYKTVDKDIEVKDVTIKGSILKGNPAESERNNVIKLSINLQESIDLDLDKVNIDPSMNIQVNQSPVITQQNENGIKSTAAKDKLKLSDGSDIVYDKANHNDVRPPITNTDTIVVDDDDDIKIAENDPNKSPENIKPSKSYLDSIVIETITASQYDPLMKTVRIKLPNGKSFKGVIRGTCSVENVLENPTIKAHLVSQFQQKKKKYSMRLDVDKNHISILTPVHNETRATPTEVVNLLSDDEDEIETSQEFETEHGKHKIKAINNDVFKKHQAKLKLKTIVSLEKLTLDEENASKGCSKPNNKKGNNIQSKTQILQESVVLNDFNAIVPVIPTKLIEGVLNDVENMVTSNKQPIVEPVVLVDDSSNDSVSFQNVPKPQEKINELKHMLFRDLGVDSLLMANTESVVSESIDLTADPGIDEVETKDLNLKIKTKNCFIKLVRCDDLASKLMRQHNKVGTEKAVNNVKINVKMVHTEKTVVTSDKVDVNMIDTEKAVVNMDKLDMNMVNTDKVIVIDDNVDVNVVNTEKAVDNNEQVDVHVVNTEKDVKDVKINVKMVPTENTVVTSDKVDVNMIDTEKAVNMDKLDMNMVNTEKVIVIDDNVDVNVVNTEKPVDNNEQVDVHVVNTEKAVDAIEDGDVNDISTNVNEDTEQNDVVVSAPVSRSSSFSLLEDFPVVDEENQKQTTERGRSSPVMEIYDLIAMFRERFPVEENIQNVNTNVKCEAEWTNTKKSEQAFIKDEISNQQEGDGDTHVTFARLPKVLKLASLLLSFIQKEDLVERYTSAKLVHSKNLNSLKRKSDPSLLPISKISKLVDASEDLRSQNLKPEQNKVIDDDDITPDLSDTDMANITVSDCNDVKLVKSKEDVDKLGNISKILIETDKASTNTEYDIFTAIEQTRNSNICDDNGEDSNIQSLNNICLEPLSESELADDIKIDTSVFDFTTDQVTDTCSENNSKGQQSNGTNNQAQDQGNKYSHSTRKPFSNLDKKYDNDTVNPDSDIKINTSQLCTPSKESSFLLSDQNESDCSVLVLDTDRFAEANSEYLLKAQCNEVDIKTHGQAKPDIIHSMMSISDDDLKPIDFCEMSEAVDEATKANNKCESEDQDLKSCIDDPLDNLFKETIDEQVHIKCDLQELTNVTKDIETDSIKIPCEDNDKDKTFKAGVNLVTQKNINIVKKEMITTCNITIPKTNDDMYVESECDYDQDKVSNSGNEYPSNSEQDGIMYAYNTKPMKLLVFEKDQIINGITKEEKVISKVMPETPKTNDEIVDALNKMFEEPEDTKFVFSEVISTEELNTLNTDIDTEKDKNTLREELLKDLENGEVVEDIVEILNNDNVISDVTIATLKSNTLMKSNNSPEKSLLSMCNAIDESSDVLSILNQYRESNGKLEIKGIKYEDPIVGTQYVFSVIKEVSDINEQDSLLSEPEGNMDGDDEPEDGEDFVLMIPKRTYKNNLLIRRSCRNMKRKKDMLDFETSKRKYRKGKNIDYPKIKASAIAELAYAKEYKLIIDYCSTIKFSYAIPFHIDNIDVACIVKYWPTNNNLPQAETDYFSDEFNDELYKDTENDNAFTITDPLQQTLSEEILNGENISNYKSIEINETNFNKGFGERSGRVIQKIETGFTKLSAATLSDVKQYQPFSTSEGSKRYSCIAHEMDSLRVKFARSTNLIILKEKVRSFFKQTAVELNKEWLQDKKIDTTFGDYLSKFPFGLTSSEFMEVPSVESVINVVQVGQLPVTAAAQNPVTCDPRVTHVSDASPSQCSDNSPGVDTQASVETKYTELTTANITLPLVQEYTQNRHQSQAPEQNLPENEDNVNGASQTLSIVKIELMEEENSQEKLENDLYDNDFSPLPNNNVEYSFDDTTNNLFNTSGNMDNMANTDHTSKTNMFQSSSDMDSTFNNIFNNTTNLNNSYMDTTPSSAESTYTNMDNAPASMYSTSPNMGNSSNDIENTANISVTSPNEETTNADNAINIDNSSTNMNDTYTNNLNPVGSESNEISNTSVGNAASNLTSPANSDSRRMNISGSSNLENASYDYSYENIEDYAANMEHNNNGDDYSRNVDNYAASVENYSSSVDDFTSNVDNFTAGGDNYATDVENYTSNVENYTTNIQNYSTNVDNYTTNLESTNSNIENNRSNIVKTSAEEPQDLSMTNSTQEPKVIHKFEGSSSKLNQIEHAMNAAGISSESVITSSADELSNLIGQSTQVTANNYTKSTPINVMTLQQALAQVLPPPLNQTSSSENQAASNPLPQQVLHIVQGSNAQTVINKPNGTHLLHIVQNKSNPGANNLSLVETGLQQGGNQLIHIVNNGNQNNAQFLKRVNLLTNLTNAQGSNEQKMIQFVCKSADGKSIQLNTGHQRSMVLRLHPTAVQTAPKPAEPADASGSTSAANSSSNQDPSQEIKSRSVYEENYAQFIQNTGPTSGPSSASTSPNQEKATSLPKFNQVFGKQSYQENKSEMEHNGLQENAECSPEENANHLGQTPEVNPPLLVRNTPPETTQAQPSPAQQIKQTISPMNIHTTMHGGVIYTRQIPVNIGGRQTINLITVPSTELVEDSPQKQQTDGSFGNHESEPSSIIKLVPHHAANNSNTPQEETNTQAGRSNETNPTPQPPAQPVLTQMRIKLPMISKGPHLVPGARIVRPSFFQIQRNVIAGTNPPVYQQVVLATAPPLGQTMRLPTQTTRSPQTQPILVQSSQHAQPSPHIPVQQVQHAPSSQHLSQQAHAASATPQPPQAPPELPKQDTEPDSELSTLTLEQLREFDMVLEQVKERSVQPTPSITPKTKPASADSTDGPSLASTSASESTQQALYSVDNSQPANVVSYVNRKSTITSATTSFVRSPDSTGVENIPSSSTQIHITQTVTTKSSTAEGTAVAPHPKKKKKKKPSSSSSALSSLGSPSKTNALKPQEDEQTTQRILYILAEYKEQVENSPDKNKPAPRRRNQFPPTIGSKRKRSHCSSRATCRREGVEMSPMHGDHGELGDDSLITLGSEDSSCGTTFSECTDCQETHSPEDTKVVRRLTFEQETTTTQITQTIPPRNVIVGDRQTITVARTTTATTAKPTTTVLMPANYLLPVSMLKGGQQIAIMTNRGPKILVGAGDSNAGALLLQRLIGPGMKPVLARSGVRHIRLPTTSLHNLQGFNIQTTPVTTSQAQPPDSTAAQVPTPAPPDLVDTRAMSSPWPDRETQDKPERAPSPDCTEPWNLPSSSIADDYGYEEIVRTDNMERTVLDAIPDRYSPDMEAQRIFDKMFDVDSKKSMYDSSRCGYDIDTSDGDDKPFPQVVQQRKDGRHHRVTHVSTAALRHKYAILEHELRLQKSLSEECEDLGVDSPSASDLFPEADILFGAPSPAHEQTIDQCTTPPPIPIPQSIPQPDLDDQIATDQLLTQNGSNRDDLDLNLDDVGEIVTVGEDGIATIPTINAEEFARSHPNTTFHTEPEDGEIPPFTIAQSIKGRHITFHANRVPGTVVMAPQTTVISQATVNSNDNHNTVKFIDIDNMINSMPCPQPVSVQSVVVKDSARPVSKFDTLKDSNSKSSSKFEILKDPGISLKTTSKLDSLKDLGHSTNKSSSKFDSLKEPAASHKSSSRFDSLIEPTPKSNTKFDSLKDGNSAPKPLSKFDSLLTDSKAQSNARPVVHSTGHGAQVIRRLRYDERTSTRSNNRFHFEEPKRTSISDEVKMRNDRAIVESMGDNASSPGQPELFWDSTPTERQERRFNFSESDKVAKSPFDELLSDSSAYGPHTRLDSVIKAARPERTFERTSFEGISVSGSSEESRPLRTYPPKRAHTLHTQDSERHFTLKTTTHHHDTDRNKKTLTRCQESEGRRRTGRGLVKRGCSCCNGSSVPPKKRSRPKKPCPTDTVPTAKSDTQNLT